MIKMIVSDLDGTLLDHSKKVSERERAALKQAKAAGIELCLASGRAHADMQQVMNEIEYEAHSVSQNGAFIYLRGGALLHAKVFAPELACEVYRIAKNFDMVKLICSVEGNYSAVMTPAEADIQSRMFSPLLVREDAEAALTGDISASKFSFFAHLDVLLEVKRRLEEQLGGQLEIFLSDHDCLDVMPLGVSKGSSLLVLLDRLGLRPDEIACCGDSFNDVSMFGITPHSFAMIKAHADVRQAAAYQVHSVAEVLEHVHAYNRSFSGKESTAL